MGPLPEPTVQSIDVLVAFLFISTIPVIPAHQNVREDMLPSLSH